MSTDPPHGNPPTPPVPPPAGWYPDPSDPGRLRWWDGTVWSEEFADSGVSGARPSGAATPGDPVTEPVGGAAAPPANPAYASSAAADPPARPASASAGPPAGSQTGGPPKNTPALIALILGIVALLLNPLLLTGIAAIVLGAIGLGRAKRLSGLGRPQALTGLILGAVATLVWIVVGALLISAFLAAPRTSGATPVPGASGPASSPGTSPETTPDAELSDCWDGSTVEAGETCPPLAGSEGLQWVFPLDSSVAATCQPYDAAEFSPEGAEEVLSCTWDDLLSTEVYITRFPGSGVETQALWRDYLSLYEDVSEAEVLDGDNREVIRWTAVDAQPETASTESVLAYAEAPFALTVWTDFVNGGTEEEHTEAISRIQFRDVAEVESAHRAGG